MNETKAVYFVDTVEPDLPAADSLPDPLPEPFAEFLITRRRSLITELRQIETILRLPQSIPRRNRPH